MDGDEQRRTSNQFLVIQIARVHAGRKAVDLPLTLCWSDSHAAEEGSQGHLNSRSKDPNLAFSVERNNARSRAFELLRKKTGALEKEVVRIRIVHSDFADPDLKHVAGFGSFDGDWTSEQMNARRALGS